MAELVAGGADELRQRPFAANYINIANPLRHNPQSIAKLMWRQKHRFFINLVAYMWRAWREGVSLQYAVAYFLICCGDNLTS